MTIIAIPVELHDQIEYLIVDNHSEDQTVERAREEIERKKYPFKIHLIRNQKNYGYATGDPANE